MRIKGSASNVMNHPYIFELLEPGPALRMAGMQVGYLCSAG